MTSEPTPNLIAGASQTAPDWHLILSLNVIFTFDEQWEIGPASDVNAARLRFPPGGGAHTAPLRIGPVDLRGLSPDAVATLVQKRAADMATLAEAIAAANIQFSEALASIGQGLDQTGTAPTKAGDAA